MPGGISKILGAAILGKKAVGEKPTVPQLPRIDAIQIQLDALAGNQASLSGATALSAAVNRSNAAQLRLLLNRGGQLDLAESVVNSQLRGELSSDVQRQISDMTAAEAAGLGLGGSQWQVGRAGLRGALSSLQLQQQGLANFGTLAQLTTPQQFGVQAMFMSPEQRYAIASEQQAAQFGRDWLHAQVAAGPDPRWAAIDQGFQGMEANADEMANTALGSM